MVWVIYIGLVVLFSCNLLACWFDGGLRDAWLRKLGWISDDVVGREAIDIQLITQHGILGAGLACPICTSGYFAAAVGALFVYLFGLPLWFIALSFISPQLVVRRLFT